MVIDKSFHRMITRGIKILTTGRSSHTMTTRSQKNPIGTRLQRLTENITRKPQAEDSREGKHHQLQSRKSVDYISQLPVELNQSILFRVSPFVLPFMNSVNRASSPAPPPPETPLHSTHLPPPTVTKPMPSSSPATLTNRIEPDIERRIPLDPPNEDLSPRLSRRTGSTRTPPGPKARSKERESASSPTSYGRTLDSQASGGVIDLGDLGDSTHNFCNFYFAATATATASIHRTPR